MPVTKIGESTVKTTPRNWGRGGLAVVVDVVVPLAVFYGARAAGANQWLALVLASVAPILGIAYTWNRRKQLDPTGVFVIAAMALSTLVAFITGDPRALLARESWITGAFGLWFIGSLLFKKPFLVDIAIKCSPPAIANRLENLWPENRIFRKWMVLASIAWGSAFLVDAVARIVMAYTLPIDQVPALGVIVLICAIVLAQAFAMIYGRRSGALALLRNRS